MNAESGYTPWEDLPRTLSQTERAALRSSAGSWWVEKISMSKPLHEQTHAATTSTGPSEPVRSKAHVAAALFVAADTSDLTSITVRIEISPDGEVWAPLTRPDGTTVEVSLADLNADGNAYVVSGMGAAVTQQLRVHITEYTGSSPVSTWITTGGWNGPAFGV